MKTCLTDLAKTLALEDKNPESREQFVSEVTGYQTEFWVKVAENNTLLER